MKSIPEIILHKFRRNLINSEYVRYIEKILIIVPCSSQESKGTVLQDDTTIYYKVHICATFDQSKSLILVFTTSLKVSDCSDVSMCGQSDMQYQK